MVRLHVFLWMKKNKIIFVEMKNYGKLLLKNVGFKATLDCLWDHPSVFGYLFLKMKIS